ncbi:MAG: cyclic pyranopterin monophosphate synthase MoaC [Acidimicrobiia bacterium]|nr:cyclic pyranopterin monophosphate synthase MoaC [Acidimicrobiia bacterium]
MNGDRVEEPALTHIDESGAAHMVDVTEKEDSDRRAVAEAIVTMDSSTRDRLFAGDLPKGDAVATVRLAGIMGAKRTAELIPLAHPIPITAITLEVNAIDIGVRLLAMVRTTAPTGVEMEALTAVSTAALSLYDMVKAVERGVTIGPVRLLEKSGGRSGQWRRKDL